MTDTENTEQSPLLPTRNHGEVQDEASCETPEVSTAIRIAVGISCLCLLTAIEVGDTLLSVPRTQIEEEILCRNLFPDVASSISDPRCKENNVQSELSMLQGLEVTFTLLPGLLMAIPYGIIADRYGRKFVLGLALLGIILTEGCNIMICRFPQNFSIQFVWVSPVFMLIGGGPTVAVAMLFTMANDISTDDQRTTTFLHLGVAALLGDLVARPATYLAMERGPWFSICIGYGCYFLSFLAVFSLPKHCDRMATLKVAQHHNSAYTESLHGKARLLSVLRQRAVTGVRQVAESAHFLFRENKKLGMLLISMLVSTFGRFATIILQQYISKRFGWTWSQASLLLSIKSMASVALLLVILPAVSQLLLSSLGLTPLTKDLWLARGSIILLMVGCFMMAFASIPIVLVMGLTFYSLGGGYASIMRGLISNVANGYHVGMLFTTLSFLETGGMLISGPLLATTFRVGLNWGGVWVGLPFMTAGGLLACAALVITTITFGDGGCDLLVND